MPGGRYLVNAPEVEPVVALHARVGCAHVGKPRDRAHDWVANL